VRVLAITNNLKQASYRLRIAALVAPLAARGVDLAIQVRPRSFFARRRLLRSAADYDAVILQRKLLDPGDAELLKSSGKSIFFDVDDAVMHHNRNVGFIERWRTNRRFEATTAMADHVVAGNKYLAEIFRRRGAVASIIPTTVDPAEYVVKTHAPTSAPRLVWVGSRSTIGYLEEALPAIAEAATRVPGLSLTIIADVTLQHPTLPIEFVPWSAATQSEALLHGDIGIAPTPIDPWTLGKCGFKIVQYMAAGLPTIASPVGANAEIVVDGQTGVLPATWSDWPGAIERLANEVEMRKRFGVAARRRVEELYSVESAADAWATLLRNKVPVT
jgi:glycosyltransferase involved in cell wall biosynthesis